jgi:hypothetical protein
MTDPLQTDDEKSGGRYLLVLLGVSCVAFLLGIYRLADKSLWGDEFNVIWFMTGERDLALSSGNGLVYLPVLKAMSWLGGTDFLYRFPAVLAGVVCIPLLFGVARAMALDRLTALAATLFLAVSPMFVAHMQQVQVYTLFCAVSLLALLLYLQGRNRQGPGGSAWPACAVVLALGFHVHHFTVFVALNIILIHLSYLVRSGLWRSWPRLISWRNVMLTSATAVICGAILWPLMVDWVVPLATDVLAKILGNTPETEYFRNPPKFKIDLPLFTRLAQQILIWKTPYPWIAVLLAGLCIIGCVAMAIRDTGQLIVVGIWTLAPPLPAAVFSYYSNIDFGSRRLIFLLPIMLVCGGAGAMWVVGRLSRLTGQQHQQKVSVIYAAAVVTTVVATIALSGLRHYYVVLEYPDHKRMAMLLENRDQPGDLVVAWRPERYRYYYRGKTAIVDISTAKLETLETASDDGHRIWYLRPGNVDQWDLYKPIAEWFDGKGGFVFSMGGGLKVSYISAAAGGSRERLEEIANVLEGGVALKPGRYYLRLKLAEVYRELGRTTDYRKQQSIGRALRR